MKKVVSTLLLPLVASFNLNASVVTIGAYELDTTTNIVTDSNQNLEWLQWDETIGMSISTALTQYAASGWRVATQFEMASLIGNLFDVSLSTDNLYLGEGNTWGYSHGSAESEAFMSLFGETNSHCYEDVSLTCVDDPWESTNAWFYETFENGVNNAARVQVEATTNYLFNNAHLIEKGQYVGYRVWSGEADYWSYDDYGVALVRGTASSSVTSEVTSPSPLALLLAGVGVMAFRRYVKR